MINRPSYRSYLSYSRERQLACCPFCGRHVRRTTQVQAVGLPPARREGEKGSPRHA